MARILSDSRTWRTSSQADPKTLAPFHISVASTRTTAELSSAIERMRQRIGTARTSWTTRTRVRATKFACFSAAPSWSVTAKVCSLHLADAFDQLRRLRIALRLVVDSGHRRLERLLVDIGDNDDAGGFRLPARLFLEIAPSFAHVLTRAPRLLAEDVLVVGRQHLPGLQRYHQNFRAHRVFRERVVAGMLVMIRGDEGGPVVLGAVDQPCRKSGEHLAIREFYGVGAERAHHLAHLLGLLNADAQPLQIRQRAHRADAVVDRPRAGIVERQAHEAIGFETAEDFRADRAVQHLLHVLDGTEQEWQRQHVHRRHDIADQRHIGAVEVDGAGAGLLEGFLFLAEQMRVKHFYLMPA